MSAEFVPLAVPRGRAAVSAELPALFVPHPKAAERFLEFFTANIRNENTRRAYYKAVCRFSDWCEERGLRDLANVKPLHVAAHIEALAGELAKPTVKQHLAALRMLFDWLVVRHVLEVNPAHAVRGSKHVVRKGRTPSRSRGQCLESIYDDSEDVPDARTVTTGTADPRHSSGRPVSLLRLPPRPVPRLPAAFAAIFAGALAADESDGRSLSPDNAAAAAFADVSDRPASASP